MKNRYSFLVVVSLVVFLVLCAEHPALARSLESAASEAKDEIFGIGEKVVGIGAGVGAILFMMGLQLGEGLLMRGLIGIGTFLAIPHVVSLLKSVFG